MCVSQYYEGIKVKEIKVGWACTVDAGDKDIDTEFLWGSFMEN